MATEREIFFNEMNGRGDGIVRSHVGITYPVWEENKDKLDWIDGFSPYMHIGASKTPGNPPYTKHTDRWGCGWIYPLSSLDGNCIEHPLDDWSKFAAYTPPDPEDYTDWKAEEEKIRKAKEQGNVASCGSEHGFFFLRLTYLRGFENFMVDAGEANPLLDDLIAMIETYWMTLVKRWIELGVDMVSFGDDLGLQHALPISPAMWRRIIKPTYKRLFSYCRENGVHVFLHTDGYIVDIIPDLIECGVTTLNPQELVNGLDSLVRLAKGKVFLELDIDRQSVTVFGTPDEVDAHIKNCIATLGSANGGLSLIWGIYPPTPYENIHAALHAMHAYADYWRR